MLSLHLLKVVAFFATRPTAGPLWPFNIYSTSPAHTHAHVGMHDAYTQPPPHTHKLLWITEG